MSVDLLVIGETLLDFLPGGRGPMRSVTHYDVHPGGAPANVALGAARLGCSTGLISILGEDEFGRLLIDRLEAGHVDCSQVSVAAGVRTGLCFVTLDEQGERTFTHRGGDPFMGLEPAHIDAERVRSARILKFSASPFRVPHSTQAIHHALDHASGLVCCDPGSIPRAWGDPAEVYGRLLEVVSRIDIFKCSADESLLITGQETPEGAARQLVDWGVRVAIITLGEKGALWKTPTASGESPSPRVDVVDTTGAGDGFMAGLIARLAQAEEPRAQLQPERLASHIAFACQMGAAVTTQMGAVNGIPHRST